MLSRKTFVCSSAGVLHFQTIHVGSLAMWTFNNVPRNQKWLEVATTGLEIQLASVGFPERIFSHQAVSS
jgi:hypothetical protein